MLRCDVLKTTRLLTSVPTRYTLLCAVSFLLSASLLCGVGAQTLPPFDWSNIEVYSHVEEPYFYEDTTKTGNQRFVGSFVCLITLVIPYVFSFHSWALIYPRNLHPLIDIPASSRILSINYLTEFPTTQTQQFCHNIT
jgi:hypothetical protein